MFVRVHGKKQRGRIVGTVSDGVNLDRNRQPVVSKGLEAEAAGLLGGLPHRDQVSRTLQVKRHALHHLQQTTQGLLYNEQ